MKPNVAADLFALVASTMQAQLEEVFEGVEGAKPTAADLNRRSAETDELKSEGRVMRPFRTNFKE